MKIKLRKESLMNDKLFLRVYIAIVIFFLAIISAFLIGIFFSIPLNSFLLWLGSFLVFYSFYFIYIIPLPWKVSAIMVAILLITLFAHYSMSWSTITSLISGIGVVTVILFVYLIL